MLSSCWGSMRLLVNVWASAFMLVAGLIALYAADPAATSDATPVKPSRIAWTTSRVVGTPDPPPPYRVVRAFPNLKFDHPLLMTRFPEGDRLLVGEENGVVYSFANRPDAKAEVFCDFPKEIKTLHLLPEAKAVDRVYALAFHPNFATNRYCFACYTVRTSEGRRSKLNEGSRVSRFKVTKSDPPRIDPATEDIIITFPEGGHNGADLHFGPDRMLYISTGDGAGPNPPDPLNTGQDISDLLSSILRIDVDQRDRSANRNYSVPKDNPFIGMKGARPEIWAYGFRNPWRMSFDRQTGELFVGDVGWELWEMVHRVEKGGNYGWSAMEGPQAVKPEKAGPTPILPPLIELPHTIACSITGGYVYRGKKFPELRGAYIFGDWETRRLWAARFEGDRTKEMPEITRPSVRIVAFGEDKDGELYVLDYDVGTVHTIERNDGGEKNDAFPITLSQTGLFASVQEHTPAPGVVPFQINSRQWLDGATAERWLALPGDSAAILHAGGKPVPGLVNWHHFRMHFPKNAVLMRTISLDGQRIETQLLHFEGADWRAYTFAWREDQADADLVPADGAEMEVRNGGRKQIWQLQSRSQCMSCHSNQSEYALAFLPEQLNRRGPDGRNQLIALTEGGYLQRMDRKGVALPSFDEASAAREPRIVDPADLSQPLDARARAYLHGNCSHCHSDNGGGTVPLRLNYSASTAEMRAASIRPARGDFGLPDACIIKPGDPFASTLYFRMAKFGRDRMPHIGSELPDESGLKLVEQWIAGLSVVEGQDVALGGQPNKVLADPKAALRAARKLGRGELSSGERDELLAAAAKLAPGMVRDLFEGYLPLDDKSGRKLGSSPRPRAILTLPGDSGRGEALFWSSALNCGACHKIGDRGTPLGPDLSTIGRLRSRQDLLESLLEPSRRIEPKYAAYMAHTADGRAFTGLLVQRAARAVVLRDGQNKEITLGAKDVQELRPARMSLMPQGQLAGLTAQEAADLLQYLVSRK